MCILILKQKVTNSHHQLCNPHSPSIDMVLRLYWLQSTNRIPNVFDYCYRAKLIREAELRITKRMWKLPKNRKSRVFLFESVVCAMRSWLWSFETGKSALPVRIIMFHNRKFQSLNELFFNLLFYMTINFLNWKLP